MTMTPNGSLTSYISNEEFLTRKDWRTVGQLVNDDGTQMSHANLLTSTVLQTILEESSGEVESALVASARYSAQDLQSTNGVSREYLKGIIADIAMWRLFGRRPAPGPPETATLLNEEAWKKIEKLSNGEVVLSFQQVQEAGVPTNEFMTTPELKELNLFSDSCGRSLGIRNSFRRGSF